jgi:hypothetical protein
LDEERIPGAMKRYQTRVVVAAEKRRPVRAGRRTVALLCATLFIAALLVSCAATQSSGTPADDVPGFWLGLWHGFIAPVTFIVSLFTEHVRIYAFPNAGRWYDFGFMLGISGFSGGIFARPGRKE